MRALCSDGHCISLALLLSLAAEDLAGSFKTDEVTVLEVSDHLLAGGIRMFGKMTGMQLCRKAWRAAGLLHGAVRSSGAA